MPWHLLIALLPFSIKSVLTPLDPTSYLCDSVKLIFLGSVLELVRRFVMWAMERFQLQCSTTAHFNEGDPSFDWVSHFLTEQKVWKRSREFKVLAKTSKRQWSIPSAEDTSKIAGHVDFLPTYDIPQLFRWKGHLLEVRRTFGQSSSSFWFPLMLAQHLSEHTPFTLSLLFDFVEQARSSYMNNMSKPHVLVHVADATNYTSTSTWNVTKTKNKRSLDSVVLPNGRLSSLIRDAREFLDTEAWYLQAGIPHRRGYLLHGPPGTGKSSTIYAIAGELGMEIYSLSLSSGFVDDGFLERAISSIPTHSILLLEDIDCAFPSREEADALAKGLPIPFNALPGKRSSVSLSGLLNVIDGCGAEEGKLFFATTNYLDRIDPALLRPGRVDVKVEYRLASQEQARDLFLRFFNRSTEPGIDELASAFMVRVPEDEFSTAELQGFLLGRKRDPKAASEEVTKWVEDERKERNRKALADEARRFQAQKRHDAALRGLPLNTSLSLYSGGMSSSFSFPGSLPSPMAELGSIHGSQSTTASSSPQLLPANAEKSVDSEEKEKDVCV
ncbi:P-loop containing nucleoside triphosphate hydrolase protein [Flagelloscypha sp. PMI_526]|nr:P-loop containing nucleoside triphosphate hydrolase protein [Flagelloscypha sp. PMI_526]